MTSTEASAFGKRWLCNSCHSYWWQEAQAVACCAVTRCATCGGKCAGGTATCALCDPALLAHQQELLRLAKAVDYADYEEPFLFWETAVVGGRYFRTQQELLQFCAVEGRNPPTWVWGTTPIPFRMDAEDLLDTQYRDSGFPIRQCISDAEVQVFQAFLDDWTAASHVCSYHIDYGTAVYLDAKTA